MKCDYINLVECVAATMSLTHSSVHWLRVPERFRSKVACLVYNVLCTSVPWPVHLRCRTSKSPRTSLFLQRLPRPASCSPLYRWQTSIFGCWHSGVELPATGSYVGAISDNLPHSTRDVSVHWCMSGHLAYLTFFVSTRCLQGGPKSKPIPNNKKIVLNCIKVCL